MDETITAMVETQGRGGMIGSMASLFDDLPSDVEFSSDDERKKEGRHNKREDSEERRSNHSDDYSVSDFISATAEAISSFPGVASMSNLLSAASSELVAPAAKTKAHKTKVQKEAQQNPKEWDNLPSEHKLQFLWESVQKRDHQPPHSDMILKTADGYPVDFGEKDSKVQSGGQEQPKPKICPQWKKTGDCKAGVKCGFIHDRVGRKASGGGAEIVEDSVGHAIEKPTTQKPSKADKGHERAQRRRSKEEVRERMIPAILKFTPHLPLR
jgi:hypothetical protein